MGYEKNSELLIFIRTVLCAGGSERRVGYSRGSQRRQKTGLILSGNVLKYTA